MKQSLIVIFLIFSIFTSIGWYYEHRKLRAVEYQMVVLYDMLKLHKELLDDSYKSQEKNLKQINKFYKERFP